MTTLATLFADELAGAARPPRSVRPMAVVPIGWPGRPLGPPRRLPFSERAYRDRYGAAGDGRTPRSPDLTWRRGPGGSARLERGERPARRPTTTLLRTTETGEEKDVVDRPPDVPRQIRPLGPVVDFSKIQVSVDPGEDQVVDQPARRRPSGPAGGAYEEPRDLARAKGRHPRRCIGHHLEPGGPGRPGVGQGPPGGDAAGLRGPAALLALGVQPAGRPGRSSTTSHPCADQVGLAQQHGKRPGRSHVGRVGHLMVAPSPGRSSSASARFFQTRLGPVVTTDPTRVGVPGTNRHRGGADGSQRLRRALRARSTWRSSMVRASVLSRLAARVFTGPRVESRCTVARPEQPLHRTGGQPDALGPLVGYDVDGPRQYSMTGGEHVLVRSDQLAAPPQRGPNRGPAWRTGEGNGPEVDAAEQPAHQGQRRSRGRSPAAAWSTSCWRFRRSRPRSSGSASSRRGATRRADGSGWPGSVPEARSGGSSTAVRGGSGGRPVTR